MEKNQRIARRLFVLWVVCYFIFSIASSLYVSYQQVINGIDPTVFLSDFQLISFGTIVLFFIPLLFTVLYFVKRSNLMKLRKIIVCLLVILMVWAIFMLLCTFLAYVAPETFAYIISLSK